MDELASNSGEFFWKKLFLVLGPIISLIFLVVFDLDPEHPEVTRTAAVSILMAIWWITEVIPLGVTSLLPLVLFPLFQVMSGKQVAPIYFNNIVFLFIGAFIVALAMEKWGLHRRIGLRILTLMGSSAPRIIFGFMITTAFLSMWISNTATTMIMIPIALAVILKIEEISGGESTKGFTIALLLGIAYSASIGGITTLIGTPPNLVFIRIFRIYFPEAPEISFLQWMLFALPISVLFLFIAWFFLLVFHGVFHKKFSLDSEYFNNEYKALGKISFEEKVVLWVFVLMALLWITRAEIQIGSFTIPGWSNIFQNPGFIDDSTVAIAMAVLLFLIPARKGSRQRIMDWHTAARLPWNIILLFGGGFALAEGMRISGLSQWIGNHLHGLSSVSPVLIITSVSTLVTFLTELTSNTATTQMILPIMASIAVAIQINPLLIMLPATLSSSFAFMLPVATPPNAVVFGTGRLKVIQMVRIGLLMNLIGIILVLIFVYLLGMFIFNIQPGEVPMWVGE
jgi:sodium-dependent dicarboxylate transporter 2/3/5